MEPTQPEAKIKPTVQLSGEDGNAFAIMGRVRKALIRAGQREEADAFLQEAKSGNYDHLLQTCFKYVDVE